MKDKLGGKTMKGIVGLGGKRYSYLPDNNDEDKIQNRERKFKFENYKNVLEETQIKNKINHSEK